MDKIQMLRNELWDLMLEDGGSDIDKIHTIKKRADRMGYAKRMLVHAIDRSSLGVFNGMMWFFTGKLYESITKAAFHKVLFDLMERRLEMSDGDILNPSAVYYDCDNCVFARPLSISNSVMVFRNGVLDVERGEFHRKFSSKFVQIWAVDYDYNPDAKTFLWRQFIDQVLPDKHLQDVLQMFLGATFCDRQKVKIEHIMILLGHGANGKSVIQGAVKGVLGEDYVAEESIGKLCAKGVEGEMAAANINGKRLNYCTEMEVTDFYRKTARLKALISGERVTARQLYVNPFYVTNVPLLMANANQIPIFNKKDEAMMRRIYVIPFNVTIPEERQNKSLGTELIDEYPAILNWILEGRQKFVDNGYKLPQDTSTDIYIINERTDFNSALWFMRNKMKYEPKLPNVSMCVQKWVTLKELYPAYQRWCRQNDKECYGRTTFSNVLVDEGGYVRQRKAGGVSFGVYSADLMHNRRRHAREKERSEDMQEIPHMWMDGVLYVFSLASLAKYAGAGATSVRALNMKGYFAPYTKGYREKTAYDVQKCIEVMKVNHVIATDEEREILSKMSKERAYHRRNFNEWSAYNGFPYRMYDNADQMEPGVIVVGDEVTHEDAIGMAKKAGYDVSKATRYKQPHGGAFSRNGKMAERRPTANEIRIIEELERTENENKKRKRKR